MTQKLEINPTYEFLRTPTQKPAAHFCGRVLSAAIHFGQNTMLDRTSQEFDLHRWKSFSRRL
jgi:hypothetical protein